MRALSNFAPAIGIAIACIAALAACDGADSSGPGQGSGPSTSAPPAADTRSGAQKMKERLEAFARDAKTENSFYGDAPVKRQQAELAAAGNNAVKKWRAQHLMGWHLLRLGRVEEAVKTLEAARALLPQVMNHLLSGREKNFRSDQYGTPIPGKETVFDLGVAYMRLAETENCCAMHNPESCLLPLTGGARHTKPESAKKAMSCFLEVLAVYPEHVTSRWLLCVAAMVTGSYPDAVPAKYRMIDGAMDSDEPFPRFKDVAIDLHLDDPDPSGGAIFDDFDGDGDLDLVTSSVDPSEPLHFMANAGDGTFTDRSEDAGFAPCLGGLNLVQGDTDNDGDLDILVLRGAWWGKGGHVPNSLLQNDGHARFTDVTYEAGLADPAFPSQAANFADFDLDGDLDLYIGNESDDGDPCPSQLFKNNGDGTFTDIAKAAGVENMRFAKGVAWGDIDNDRDPDLYVSNLGTPNRLYVNNGDGTFTETTDKAGVSKPIRSFPTWFFDSDNDGNLDLFVASYWNQPHFAVAQFFGIPVEAELARLYHGDGKGAFTDVTVESNLVKMTMPMGANFGDLDNDGFPDFYLGTGYPSYEGIVPNFMYWNRGGKRFSDVSIVGGFSNLQKGHAVSFADFDGDGDQDVFEQMGGAYPGDGYQDVLYQNPGFGNHWLKVLLVGAQSNRFGVGARIRIEVVEGDRTHSIFKWVNSGGSFGCNPLRQEIGLGKATRVAKLEVFWPRTDTTQSFANVPLDAIVEITEGKNELHTIARPTPSGR